MIPGSTPTASLEFDAVWARFEARYGADLPPGATVTLDHEPTSDFVPDLPADTIAGAPISLGPIEATVGSLPHLSVQAAAGDAPLLAPGGVELTYRRTLGEGGMGRVDLAIQHSLRREVAVKTPKGSRRNASHQALVREALFTGFLEHPNIIPVHQLGRNSQGEPVLVMKRVEGTEWSELLKDPHHPFFDDHSDEPLGFHLGVLIQVCNAVAFAHSRDIVHRDIKPDNVMIGGFGEVYLLDWGLAIRLSQKLGDTTGIVGTPHYMAPEMLVGDANVDARTDVYLLGAVLSELLAGHPPHLGDNVHQVLFSVHDAKPPVLPPDAPHELAELATGAMAADRDDRPQSVLDFRRRLDEFLTHRGALKLVETGEAALSRFREHLTSGEEIAEDASQARFAFQQALLAWQGSVAATDGLQKTLELLVEHELYLDHPGAARRLLDELPRERTDLRTRVDALEADHKSKAADQHRLQRLRYERDPTVADRDRARYAFVLGAVLGVTSTAFIAAGRAGLFEIGPAADIIGQLIQGSMILLGLVVVRKRAFSTQFNRQLSYTVMGTVLIPLIARICVALAGLSSTALGIMDLLVLAMWQIVVGIAMDSRTMLVLPVWLTFAVLVAVIPEYALLLDAAGVVLGTWTLALVWQFGARLTPLAQAAARRPRFVARWDAADDD